MSGAERDLSPPVTKADHAPFDHAIRLLHAERRSLLAARRPDAIWAVKLADVEGAIDLLEVAVEAVTRCAGRVTP